jgi:hypothetical protein
LAVRRESVVLELDDKFSRGMLAAATTTKALEGALRDLDGSSVDTTRSLDKTSTSTDRLSTSAVRGTRSIDQFSGRLGILLKIGASLGPALIPIGAVAIPAVAGLANQLGLAAVAAGTAVLAFQGIGTALQAVNKAGIEPTAANLQAARDAMAALSPAGRDLINQLQEMKPLFEGLRNTAAEGLFPGVIRGFESLEELAPRVNSLIAEVAETMGRIFARGANSLASDRWADFFEMLESEARPTLKALATTIGDFAHGMSELWEAFAPLNANFGQWLASVADGFDKWATGLSATEGFADFLAYIDQMGPKVGEALGAIANALLQIVQATAPIAGPVLDALTGLANAIAAIADSDLGTPIIAAVAAMSALSLASNLATASVTRLQASLSYVAANPITIALAGIAAGATNAATQFDRWQNGTQDLGDSLLRVAPGFRELAMASDWLGISLPGLEEPVGTLTGGLKNALPLLSANQVAMIKLADGAQLSAAEIRGLTEAMLENKNANIAAFDAVTQYRQALKDARKQADDNNAGINGNSKAALANRVEIAKLTTAWNNQSGAVRNNIEKFREARQNFLDVARDMGVPIEQAIRLADKLFAIPRSTHVKLLAEDRATAKIVAIQRLIDYYGLTKAQATALVKDLASGKVKTVQQLIDKYGLTKAEAKALLDDAASGKLNNVLGLLRQADGFHAKSTITITTIKRTQYELGQGGHQPGDHSGGAPDIRGRSTVNPGTPEVTDFGEFNTSSKSAALAAYRADYASTAQTYVGSQSVQVDAAAAEIRALRQESASATQETNQRLENLSQRLGAIDHGVRHVGPGNTASGLAKELRKVGAEKQRAEK